MRPPFCERVQAGNFLEHATVYGHSYGILKSEVLGKLRQGQDVLLNVDVQGAATIRERAQEEPELGRALVSVFLTPPSLAVLEERLRKRGTDSAAVDSKAAERRPPGDRPVEEFRLPAHQRERARGPAAHAGGHRGREGAHGASAGAGVLTGNVRSEA